MSAARRWAHTLDCLEKHLTDCSKSGKALGCQGLRHIGQSICGLASRHTIASAPSPYLARAEPTNYNVPHREVGCECRSPANTRSVRSEEHTSESSHRC